MSYFMSPHTHPGLPASGQGGAAPSASSLGLCSPAEPMVVAPGQLGLLSQKAEQVTSAAQAWGLALAAPEARGFPRGTGWEMLPWRKEPSRYCHTSPHLRQPESLGWEDGGSRSRAAQLHGPNWPRPLLLCGLSPGALPMPSEAGGKEADSQPDICILTLAMMIAGIPTVPVPGLREEDLIRAAQAFMMAHPEPEEAVEGCGGNRYISMQPLGRCP